MYVCDIHWICIAQPACSGTHHDAALRIPATLWEETCVFWAAGSLPNPRKAGADLVSPPSGAEHRFWAENPRRLHEQCQDAHVNRDSAGTWLPAEGNGTNGAPRGEENSLKKPQNPRSFGQSRREAQGQWLGCRTGRPPGERGHPFQPPRVSFWLTKPPCSAEHVTVLSPISTDYKNWGRCFGKKITCPFSCRSAGHVVGI